MREKVVSILAATVLGCASGTACAMTSDGQHLPSCRVNGGEKLPAESGGPEALCQAISDAISDKAPGLDYKVEVTVSPLSRLSATVTTADGRRLADQQLARSDRALTRSSFERFAKAIANELAKAGAGRSES